MGADEKMSIREAYIVDVPKGADVRDVIAATVESVWNKKSKAKGGKYVFMDPEGHVIKVTTITGPGKTEQSYKDDTDINRLLEPAMRKGLLRHVARFVGEYDDIPVESFQDAQFVVSKGKNMYEALPARVRAKFNGPGEFMEFVQNPDNKPWLKKHGLLKGLDGVDRHGRATGYNPNPPPPEEADNKNNQPEGVGGAAAS